MIIAGNPVCLCQGYPLTMAIVWSRRLYVCVGCRRCAPFAEIPDERALTDTEVADLFVPGTHRIRDGA